MILEDVLTWTRWLADTRVSVEPSGISESTKVAPLLYRRSMPLSRSIRPMLSRLHLHVLPILDMVHIPVAFSETSEIRSREEVAAMAPPDGLSQGSGPFTRHVGLTCSNSESLAARATVKPWRRPFDSAFKRLSDTTVSLRYSSRVNKARRAHPETGRISYLAALTVHCTVTYYLAKPALGKVPTYLRGAPLTKITPQDQFNYSKDEEEGHDTQDHFHIFHRYDIIPNQTSRYLVLAAPGAGAYGQVLKCQDLSKRDLVAIKVAKYHSRPYQISYQKEKDILAILNAGDPEEKYHIIRLKETFYFHNHGCLVFMSGGPSLIACLTNTVYRGLSLKEVHNYTVQLLIAIRYMHHSGWVHTDLKPDNVLTDCDDPMRLWLIDFGLAEHVSTRVQETYKQTRYYRAPETILRCQTTSAIDLWSLGCICAELFLGFPLFAAKNEYDQLRLIDKFRGPIPRALLDRSPGVNSFFEYRGRTWLYRSREEALLRADVELRKHVSREKRDKLLQGRSIAECIYAQASNKKNIDSESHLALFIDFLERLLTIDPDKRMTVDRALKHDFVRLQLPGKIWLEMAFGRESQTLANPRVRDSLPSVTSSHSGESQVEASLYPIPSIQTVSTREGRLAPVKQAALKTSPAHRAQHPVLPPAQSAKGQQAQPMRPSRAGQAAQWLNTHLQIPTRRMSGAQQDTASESRSLPSTGYNTPVESSISGRQKGARRYRLKQL